MDYVLDTGAFLAKYFPVGNICLVPVSFYALLGLQ